MKQKTKKQRSRRIRLAIDFIKLQLAGNVLFWGTYIGYWLLNNGLFWPELTALVVASLLAHGAFFVINKQWVFVDKTGRRKTHDEITRFAIFMGFNFFLNIAIIQALSIYFGIIPEYGQFISALFFTVWSFVGLRFWVFQETRYQAVRYRPRGEREANL